MFNHVTKLLNVALIRLHNTNDYDYKVHARDNNLLCYKDYILQHKFELKVN